MTSIRTCETTRQEAAVKRKTEFSEIQKRSFGHNLLQFAATPIVVTAPSTASSTRCEMVFWSINQMTARKFTPARLECALAQVQMARVHTSAWFNTDTVFVLTGWSSPTLYRRIQSGEFPRPVCRGKWQGGHVLAWLEAKAMNSMDQPNLEVPRNLNITEGSQNG